MLDLTIERLSLDMWWRRVGDTDARCAVCRAEIITGAQLARWQHVWMAAGRMRVAVTCGSMYCRARVQRTEDT